MRKPELILPAGDLERAKIAFRYGADAVYLGLPEFSMRKTEVRFTLKEVEEIIDFAHRQDKKVYLTFNTFLHEGDLERAAQAIRKTAQASPDAFIVSDVGLVEIIKREASNIPLHISTQANVTNSQAAKFWQDLGAKRIVLARELTLEEIKRISRKVPGVELEVFVHGAMCISYSGRCLLSAYMTGREANLGECAQPCRWHYNVRGKTKNAKDNKLPVDFFLEEKLRPGEYFPVEETEKGTTLMSSQDLRLIRYLPHLIKAGVTALKIEGRNKTEYYVATTARAYRKGIEAAVQEDFNTTLIAELETELEKLNYRGYTEGFLFGKAKRGEVYLKREPIRKWNYSGKIISCNKDFAHLVEIKNQLSVNDNVEILSPQEVFQDFIQKIFVKDQEVEKVNPGKLKQKAKILLSRSYPANSIIRKKALPKQDISYPVV